MIELEVKFLLNDRRVHLERLEGLGAELISPEVHELNLRFDLPDGSLTASHQVLRLRRDAAVRLTYKGPGQLLKELWAREEIEFAASDFETAKAFLEALGYRVSMIYEKFRSSYRLGETELMFDRTPIGDFVELEGPDEDALRACAEALGLDWQAAFQGSYAQLFEQAKAALKLDVRDMTFENFTEVTVTASTLGLASADL